MCFGSALGIVLSRRMIRPKPRSAARLPARVVASQAWSSGVAGKFYSRQRLKRACDLLRAQGCTKLVLYIWRPEFADALEQVPHDFSIYHVNDEYSFSTTEVEVSPAERRLLESVGQVFIHSPALMEKRADSTRTRNLFLRE